MGAVTAPGRCPAGRTLRRASPGLTVRVADTNSGDCSGPNRSDRLVLCERSTARACLYLAVMRGDLVQTLRVRVDPFEDRGAMLWRLGRSEKRAGYVATRFHVAVLSREAW